MVYNENGASTKEATGQSQMNEAQNLGSLIKRQRTRIGLTLLALSAKSGVSPTHLSRIEKAAL